MARKDVEPIQVHVPKGKREQIREYASSLGLELSDYVRGLIEKDMRENDGGIDLEVNRGGWRGGTEKP